MLLDSILCVIVSTLADAAWSVGFRKVFRRLGFEVNDDLIQKMVTCKPWCAEQFLMMLRERLDANNTANRGLCHDIYHADAGLKAIVLKPSAYLT